MFLSNEPFLKPPLNGYCFYYWLHHLLKPLLPNVTFPYPLNQKTSAFSSVFGGIEV